MLEKLLAYHCAPALAGIKPANIAACSKKQVKDIHGEISRLNSEMNLRGIYFEILCECEKRALIMVYRYNKLESCIKESKVSEFLRNAGYPSEITVEGYIAHLKKRLEADVFPHEIGAFLGYPIRDIIGFINHEECIFTGDWKVYGDAENARKKFHVYNMCKSVLFKHVAEGRTLAQLFCAS